MKKGQALENIKPENGSPRNFMIANYGSYTDSKALKASDAIQILIRTPKSYRRTMNCAGNVEYEDGSSYRYGCDECPENKGCGERDERAKCDKAALADFFTKTPAGLEAHEVANIRDVAQIFCNAWIERDSGFFNEMADLVDAFAAREKVTPRVSIRDRALLNLSPHHAAVAATDMIWHLDQKHGKGDEEISYAEFLQAVNDCSKEGITDRSFQRAIKLLGIKLKRGKPGPKQERKKTSGKARE